MTTHFTFTAQHPGLFDLSLLTVSVEPKVTLLDNDDYDALEDYIQADNDAAYWFLLDHLHGMGVDYDLTNDNVFGIKCDDTPRVMRYLHQGGVKVFEGDKPSKAVDWKYFDDDLFDIN